MLLNVILRTIPRINANEYEDSKLVIKPRNEWRNDSFKKENENMKIGAILSAIIVIVALIICYWKFDDKIVTTSVIAATTLVNLYNFIKQRNINKKK